MSAVWNQHLESCFYPKRNMFLLLCRQVFSNILALNSWETRIPSGHWRRIQARTHYKIMFAVYRYYCLLNCVLFCIKTIEMSKKSLNYLFFSILFFTRFCFNYGILELYVWQSLQSMLVYLLISQSRHNQWTVLIYDDFHI